jgi:KTSC domain
VRREPVVSTNLRSVGYDEDPQTLEVEFANGEVYEYQSVPEAVHRSLMQAPSKGTYFNRYIKERYVFRRVS